MIRAAFVLYIKVFKDKSDYVTALRTDDPGTLLINIIIVWVERRSYNLAAAGCSEAGIAS